MSWFNDLVPIFGGGGIIAGAMYAACAFAQKSASPEAAKEIGCIVKHQLGAGLHRPYAIIERMFVWVFGEDQFSIRCSVASLAGTVVICSVYLVSFEPPANYYGDAPWFIQDRNQLVIAMVAAVIPGYIAIAKTRYLFQREMLHSIGLFGLISIDVATSLVISTAALIVLKALLENDLVDPFRWVYLTWFDLLVRLHILNAPKPPPGMALLWIFTPWPVFIVSTLATSIWMVLILLSISVLKLLVLLRRFTDWLFDVDNQPMNAIGIVAGASVMTGSLIWFLVRLMI